MRKLLLLIVIPMFGMAQNYNPYAFQDNFSFVKNEGQFDGRDWQSHSKIEYGVDRGRLGVFFTNEGLTYRFTKIIRNPEHKEGDNSTPKRTSISELIHLKWIGANEDVQILAEESTQDYLSYAVKNPDTKEVKNINHIPGFKRIVYKNLYDNIDLVYELDSEKGMKYSLVLKPGANPSEIKAKYSYEHSELGNESCSIELLDNEIEIKTSLGEFKELAPYTFYPASNEVISSKYRFENNILSFDLSEYDSTKEIIIDPWVIASDFTTSSAVWEVECDGSGNVYVIGGETPMMLKKYNSTGTIQWTYTTPWDTASVWLGTLATDYSGISYITSGTSPEMERIDPAGNMVWHVAGSGLVGGDDEWWSITFNCDHTKLIVGGTKLFALQFEAYATIFNIDMSNGDVLSSQYVDHTDLMGFGSSPIEVRSISSSKNAKFIYLTHHEVGAISQNMGECPNEAPLYAVDNGHHLGYKCEDYLPATQNGGGLKAMVANDQYIYTNSGEKIFQRNLSDGSLVNSVSLPGGSATTDIIFNGKVVHNSGLATDACGNIYAGSGDRVVKFDQNLNILAQEVLSFSVYDVSVNSNGEVLAVGAQYDNGQAIRNGKIQSLALTACAQFALVCCDANICPVEELCVDNSPITLISSTAGGTWSGVGVNPSTGVFDPAVAGIGSHVITYTLPCGYEETVVTVSDCPPVTVCYDGTNLIASGGNGTLTWEDTGTEVVVISNEQDCIDCPDATPTYFLGNYITCSQFTCDMPAWQNYATGNTVTPSSNFPMQVYDQVGTSVVMNSLGEVASCSSCIPPTLSANPTNVSCLGGSNGAIDLVVSGTSTYNIIWTNSMTTEDISGLTAGSYTVTATDILDSHCFTTLTVTISDGSSPTPSISGNNSFCSGDNVTLNSGPSYSSYIWSGGQTTQTITATTGGLYSVTVTDGNGCTGSNSFNVTENPLPIADAGADEGICNGESATLSVAGGTSYAWSNGASTQSITVSPASQQTYTVTVTQNGCTDTDDVIVNVLPAPNASAGPDQTICNAADVTLTGSGGTSYVWSTGESTQSITVAPASQTTYFVTVSDANCSSTAQVTVYISSSLVVNVSSTPAVICEGESSQLQASVGDAFLWENGATTQAITVNPSSTTSYSVTVTDANNCTGSGSGTVTVNPLPTANAGTDMTICSGTTATLTANGGSSYYWSTGQTTQSITVSPASATFYSVTVTENNCSSVDEVLVDIGSQLSVTISPNNPVLCLGDPLTLTATGGTNFVWSSGQTTQAIIVSPPNDMQYTVNVSDVAGCTGSGTVNVTVVPDPVANAGSDITICNGDVASLSATGGESYMWSDGTFNQSISVAPTSSTTYTVTVTQDGCQATDDVTVNVAPQVNASISATLPSVCAGEFTTLTASGGNTYQWNEGSTSQAITVSPPSTTVYSVIVSDANFCTDEAQIEINVFDSVVVVVNPPDVCSGETATLTASSGDSYYWSTGETTQSISVTPLTSSDYLVTVTQNGCTGTSTVTVNVGTTPDANAGVDQQICSGSSVVLTATGGTEYEWGNGSTSSSITVSPLSTTSYYVIVSSNGCSDIDNVTVTVIPNPVADLGQDLSICDGTPVSLTTGSHDSYLWNDGSTGQSLSINPSSSAIYSVTVTDNGCSDSDSILVEMNSLPNANAGSDQTICQGDETTLTASGGTSYLWSTQTTSSSLVVSPNATTTYMVTVTDNQCSAVDSVIVTVMGSVTASISASPSEICQSQSSQLTASGGSQYLWNTGATTQAIDVSPATSVSYSVTVSEGSCSGTSTILITVNPNITATSSPSSICEGESTILNVSQGLAYLWSTGETTQSITVSPSASTSYYVTVNGAGCTDSTEVPVTVYGLPTANAGADQSICIGESVTITATGGGEYSWSNSIQGSEITVTPSATTNYSVTVTDPNGCTDNDQVTVAVYNKPTVSTISDRIICDGQNIQLYASGGISYEWSPSSGLNFTDINNPVASPTETTTYSVMITDNRGCTATGNVKVTVNPLVPVEVVINSEPSGAICAGQSVTFTTVSMGEGMTPAYHWSINGIAAGDNSPYLIYPNITSDATIGCMLVSSELCTENNPAYDELNVTISPAPKIDVDASNLRGCPPLTVQFGVTQIPNGTYHWDFGDGQVSDSQNPTHTYQEVGIYDVEVSVENENGCYSTLFYNDMVRVYNPPQAFFAPDPEYASIIEPHITFLNSTTGGHLDICSFGDGDTSYIVSGYDFSHTYDEPGTYDVQLITFSLYGCSDTAETSVLIKPEFTFYAPSAFTPERIGENEIFYVTGIGIDVNRFNLYVYDRWGELVFETNKYDPVEPRLYGWDGKIKGKRKGPVGVYTWMAVYYDESGNQHERTGSVTIIR